MALGQGEGRAVITAVTRKISRSTLQSSEDRASNKFNDRVQEEAEECGVNTSGSPSLLLFL